MTLITSYAWAAGFVDGEGYIAVSRKKPSYSVRKSGPNIGRPRRDGVVYWLQLSVAQRNPEPLHALVRLFGGNIRVCRPKRGNVYYSWRICADNALAALEAMLPFFVGKRDVAQLGVSFQRWYSASRVEFGRAMPTTRRQQAQFYHEECRRLIRRYCHKPGEGRVDDWPALAEVVPLPTGSDGR